jgi:hypothetical protein
VRSGYRPGDLPATSRLAVMDFDDHFPNLEIGAQLKPVCHPDGSISEGAPSWTPPPRPKITAVANLREDPLGRMFARYQITESQFQAGREYRACHDAAQAGGAVRSIDWSRTKVSGGQLSEPLTDHQRLAAARLRSIEATVQQRYGEVGVALARRVLADRIPIERAARDSKCIFDIITNIGRKTSIRGKLRKLQMPSFEFPACPCSIARTSFRIFCNVAKHG